MKTPTKFTARPRSASGIVIAVTLISLAFLSKIHAVSPAPDGGYPGGNTAEGQNALLSLTTGTYNTAVGLFSLLSNVDGSFNTGVGAGTLLANTAVENTATGTGALLSNTTGTENTANGAFALFNNTTGSRNDAVGASALLSNDSGSFNNAYGSEALTSNVDGSDNDAFGDSALAGNVSGQRNNGFGSFALFSHQAGDYNNAVGGLALSNDQSGFSNNALGDQALYANVTGSNNTAVGDFALTSSTGDANTALGFQAGAGNETGSNNIYIGDAGGIDESNVIAIGSFPPSGIDYTTTLIGGIYDAGETDRPVYVGFGGHLGTLVSSRRYKEEIKPMDQASEALFALKPVTFRYKQEIGSSHKLSFGLIAEEVAKVSPDLISRDREGKPQTVRYEAVNAMLLNEFLKEHRKVEEQQATIMELKSTVAQQQKGMEVLTAKLKEQAAQIQKVSAQVELDKPASQTVANK